MALSLKRYTLVFVLNGSQLLLGLKKRGFGEGKWNGFGGKLEEGEEIEDAAIREVEEECGLVIEKSVLSKVGVLYFQILEAVPGVLMEVHVFTAKEYSGEVQESDEMSPMWYKLDEIPYDKMFADDRIWFPLFLKGDKFTGNFLFKDFDTLLSHELVINPPENFELLDFSAKLVIK
ncbi:Nudix (Nucleoside diphosphate linked moiety X)-type motif 1 [Chamberlinius hualienensis]